MRPARWPPRAGPRADREGVARWCELALLDPQLGPHLRLVSANLLQERLGVLAPAEHLELDALGIGALVAFRSGLVE